MDAFEDNTFGQVESDPAAEFLAREQDALAGLDDDLAIKQEPSGMLGLQSDIIKLIFIVNIFLNYINQNWTMGVQLFVCNCLLKGSIITKSVSKWLNICQFLYCPLIVK